MASKTQQQIEHERVADAIRSLYDRFPISNRYGNRRSCNEIRTRETAQIDAKIAKRRKDLENDKELKALEEELKKLKKQIAAQFKSGHDRVSDLMNRLRLRGVTEPLLKDIETLSAEPIIDLLESDCE